MEQLNSFELILNDNSYSIPSRFDRLTKVSIKVYNDLIFNSRHKYVIESNVSEEVLESYIKYWVHEEIPNININNFYQYYNLSQEFGLLTDFLELKKEEFGDDLQFYDALKNQENNKYKEEYEEIVSKNLDNYLDRYGIEIMKLPINTLFNIFNHPNCKLTDHNLAYNLIQIQYKQSNNPSIFTLLPCLDGAKLSRSNLEDSIVSKSLHFNLMPKIDQNCLNSALQRQNEIEKQLLNLIQSSNQFSEELSLLKSSQEIESNELKELIKGQSNKLFEYDEKSAKQINDLKQFIKEQIIEMSAKEEANAREINNLKKIIKEQQNIINDNKNYIKTINSRISQLEDLVKNNNDILQKANNTQSEKISRLETQQEQIKNEVSKSLDDNRKQMNDEINKQNEKISKQCNIFTSEEISLLKNFIISLKKESTNSPKQNTPRTVSANQSSPNASANKNQLNISADQSSKNQGSQNNPMSKRKRNLNKRLINEKQNTEVPKINISNNDSYSK